MNKLFAFTISTIFIFSDAIIAQNVGIGITNPIRSKLEIHGAVDATSAIFGGESTGISLQRNWPGIGFNQYYNGGSRHIANGFAAVQFLDPGTGNMAIDMINNGPANGFATAVRRTMLLSNNGRVNIGSADYPHATLMVARGDAPFGTTAFLGSLHNSYFNYGAEEDTYIRAGKSNGRVIINDIPGGKIVMSGYVGINTATPAYPLEIRMANGKGLLMVEPGSYNHWHNYVFSGNYPALQFGFNGSVRAEISHLDGSYYHISDRRLKTNIQNLPSLLDKIMQLEPVAYEMIKENPEHKKSIGFIAQDVQKIFPELVNIKSDTVSVSKELSDVHTLNYSGFGILAIKAVQELTEQLSAMKNEIVLLKEEHKILLKRSENHKK